MSMPSSFELGRAIGGNVSGGIQQGAEMSAMDQILSQADATGDPEVVRNIMGQMIQRVAPERREMAAQILQNKYEQIKGRINQQKQAQAFGEQGLNPDLPESINKEIVNQRVSAKNKGAESALAGLDVINRQRQLLATGHLGPKVGILGTGRKFGSTLSAEGQKARAEYERLGKSLISLSSNIPIRNRSEFEVLAHDLYDPLKSQEEIGGILDAIERIIKNTIGPQEAEAPSEPIGEPTNNQKRIPLSEIF